MAEQPPHTRTLWQLLVRSVVENDRISPRLLTTFLFSAAALALLFRGATSSPVVNGVAVSTWPPDHIWGPLLLLIAGLLGLGKVTDSMVARTKIEADAKVATAGLTGQAPAGAASATTTTTLMQEAP